MKKAGIITHYDVHNHGAVLQLYALSRVLFELGYKASALTFNKNYDFLDGKNADRKYNITARSIPFYIKYLFKKGFNRTLYNYKKRKKLIAFKKQFDLIGDYYSKSNCDLVVIGSDEIFSIESGPNPWFYGIGVPCKKQISYAASFGPTTLELIESKNAYSFVEGGLKNIGKISVRDYNSYSIVKEIIGIDPSIVCDPVILYDFSNDIKKQKARKIKEKYVLVYSYDDNMNDLDTIEAIRAYAKKNDCKIYSVGYFHKWCDKNFNLNPLDLFYFYENALMVFTDTFHGTVLSLVNSAQFVAKIRGNQNKLSFLLHQFSLDDRKVESFKEIEKISNRQIDYASVNKQIVAFRKTSMDYLSKAIKSEDCERE